MFEIKFFLDENDLYQDKPKHEYIMRYLMHNSIMGASVFSAIMGYGLKHHLHHPQDLGNVDENPIMIMFIDEEEKVEKVLPHLKEVLNEGLIVKTIVEHI
jgi:PII-like signaling protein